MDETFIQMSRGEFIIYLRETLIPDLKESGQMNTASDLEAAVLFIEGAQEVRINFANDAMELEVTKIN